MTMRSPDIATVVAGTYALRLPPLHPADALGLLRALTASVQAALAEDELLTLAERVGQLPLALVLVGRHLQQAALHGAHRLTQAREHLRQGSPWLHLRSADAPSEQRADLSARASLNEIIALSDRTLDETTQNALRFLAQFPAYPNSFSYEAAMAVVAAVEGIAK